MLADAASARLTAALAGFGHSLGLGVLAVEVGHEAQLDLLRRCGCDLVQGDLLAPVLTAAEAATRLGAGEKPG